MSSPNQTIPNYVQEELIQNQQAGVKDLPLSNSTIYRYRVSNIDNWKNDTIIEENTIQILQLKDETEIKVKLNQRVFFEKQIADYSNISNVILKTLDSYSATFIQEPEKVIGQFYVYSLEKFTDDKIPEFYIQQQQLIWLNKESAIQDAFGDDISDQFKLHEDSTTLINIDTLKTAKNSKLIFTKDFWKGQETPKSISKIVFKTPIETMFSSIQADGQRYLNNTQTKTTFSNIDLNVDPNRTTQITIRPNVVEPKLNIYVPELDPNISLPALIAEQYDTASTLQFKNPIFSKIIKKILIYTYIFNTNWQIPTLDQKIKDQFNSAGTTAINIILGIYNDYLRQFPTLKDDQEFPLLKSFLNALSSQVISKYSYGLGNNDAATYLNKWYLEVETGLTDADFITDGGTGIFVKQNPSDQNSNVIYNDGNSWDPKLKIKSKYFDLSQMGTTYPLTNPQISETIAKNGEDQKFGWKDFDNPIEEFDGSTLASEITKSEKLQNYQAFLPFDKDNNIEITRLFWISLDGNPNYVNTLSLEIDGTFTSAEIKQKIMDGEIYVPTPDRSKVIVSNVINTTDPREEQEYTCPNGGTLIKYDYTWACAVGSSSDAHIYAPTIVFKPVNIPITKFTIEFTREQPNFQFEYDKDLLSRNDFTNILSSVDLVSSAKGYKEFEINTTNFPNTTKGVVQNIKNIYMKGIFGGDCEISLVGDNGSIATIGNLNKDLPQKAKINLFDEENESISLTRIRF